MSVIRRISRRALLRGVGASLALPWLEAMSAASGPRAAAARRMAFIYVPNGVDIAHWTPATEGANYELTPILEPLANVRRNVLVLSGLTHDQARAHGDGGGDHARGAAAFLTGCHPRKTAGDDLKVGMSVDQVAAAEIGRATRLPSLELGCDPGIQPGACDTGYSCAYSANISWRTESTPLPKEINPRSIFERMFGAADGGDSVSREARLADRQSVLDFVLEDAARLRARLGTGDRRKLDEYLSSVREVESRVERAATAEPSEPPAIDLPDGVPSDHAEHVRLLFDLMALAFQTDTTRVATCMLGNEATNRNYPFLDIHDGHHTLSHHGGDMEKLAAVRKINRFHLAEFARFIERLAAVSEGPTCLLDQCMIVYGSGISDGDMHNHENLPILLAGGAACDIRSGRHLRHAAETPMTNLFLSMLDRVGVTATALGDSTGRINSLEG